MGLFLSPRSEARSILDRSVRDACIPPVKNPNRTWNAALAAVFVAATCHMAEAQDTGETDPHGGNDVRIVGTLDDGTPPPSAPLPDLPTLDVEKTSIRALPDRKVIVHRVKDPKLSVRQQTALPSEIDPEDPEVQEWIAGQQEAEMDIELVIVSATIYDRQFTFLRWWVFRNDGQPEEYNAWSNVDFNYLTGFPMFEAGNTRFGLLMAIGNIDSEQQRTTRENAGAAFDPVEIPALPIGDPAYMITKGDPGREAVIAPVQGLHQLYANDPLRLITAFEGREQARREREAELKENPPGKKDLILHYWKGPRAEATTTGGSR